MTTFARCGLSALILAGCSYKIRTPAPAAEGPPFQLNQENEVAPLRAVGCEISEKDVSCADSAEAPPEERLKTMRAQTQAIGRVMAALEKRLEDGSLGLAASLRATILLAKLSALSAELVESELSLGDGLSRARRFHTVLGFNCSGKFDDGGVPATLDFADLFPSGGAANPTDATRADAMRAVPTKPVSRLTASAGLLAGTREISWRLDDGWSQSVVSDGEFSLSSLSPARLDLLCYKHRLSGTEARLTDRARPESTGHCRIELTGAYGRAVNGTMSFTSSDGDVAKSFEPEISYMPGFNYSVKLLSDHGLLKFVMFELATGRVVSVLTVSNSAGHVAFTYTAPPALGDGGARLDCRSPSGAG